MPKDYTKEEVESALAALHASGGNYRRTARDTGVPRSTLRSWATPGALMPVSVNKGVSVERVRDIAEELTNNWENLALDLQAMVTTVIREWKRNGKNVDDIKPGRVKELILSAAIATDKASLGRGRPTAFSAHASITYTTPLAELSAKVEEESVEGEFAEAEVRPALTA